MGLQTDLGGSANEDKTITALYSHPYQPDLFYVGMWRGAYELDCDGNARNLGRVPGGPGVGGLTILPTSRGGFLILQTNFSGLYQRRL